MRTSRATRYRPVAVHCLFAASFAQAAIKLPAIIGSNMVVQKNQKVPIWGWADKGQEVTVSLPGQEKKAQADDQGKWKVVFDEIKNDKPFDITITAGNDKKVLTDVVVGEVWVCSGQSNMEMGIEMAKEAQKEVAAANYPDLRLFTVEKTNVGQPASNCKGTWEPCSPTTIKHGAWGGFSAAGYYFAAANCTSNSKLPSA